MTAIPELDAALLRGDQLWYVAHPVHPTEEKLFEARQIGYEIGYEQTEEEYRRMIVRDNVAGGKAWLRWLSDRYPALTFVAPWIASLDGGGGDDLDPERRARGLRDCRVTIRACAGMVLVGGRVSAGMRDEMSCAASVVDLTHLGENPPDTDSQAALRRSPDSPRGRLVVVTDDSVEVDGHLLKRVTRARVNVAAGKVTTVDVTLAVPRGAVVFSGMAEVSCGAEPPAAPVPDQPPPVDRPDLVPVWDMVVTDMVVMRDGDPPRYATMRADRARINLVIADMLVRDRVGRERYGTPLTAYNGRDHIVDLYQELLDAAAYCRAAIVESDRPPLTKVYQDTLEHLVVLRGLIGAVGDVER